MRIRSCFLLALGFGAAFSLSADILYSVTELGGVTGWGINNAGQVTGETSDGHRAFIYSNGQMTDLGFYGSGYGINDAGQVTGEFHTPTQPSHAFLYSNGQMSDLGTFGGTYSTGYGINNAGQVTGS